jgi:hypothetical protein
MQHVRYNRSQDIENMKFWEERFNLFIADILLSKWSLWREPRIQCVGTMWIFVDCLRYWTWLTVSLEWMRVVDDELINSAPVFQSRRNSVDSLKMGLVNFEFRVSLLAATVPFVLCFFLSSYRRAQLSTIKISTLDVIINTLQKIEFGFVLVGFRTMVSFRTNRLNTLTRAISITRIVKPEPSAL